MTINIVWDSSHK